MTVVTVHRPSGLLLEKPQTVTTRQCATLPRKLMRGRDSDEDKAFGRLNDFIFSMDCA